MRHPTTIAQPPPSKHSSCVRPSALPLLPLHFKSKSLTLPLPRVSFRLEKAEPSSSSSSLFCDPLPSRSPSIGVMSFRSSLLFSPRALSSPPARPSTGRRRRPSEARQKRIKMGKEAASPPVRPSSECFIMPRRRRNDASKTPFQTRERSKKEERRQSVSGPTPPSRRPLLGG